MAEARRSVMFEVGVSLKYLARPGGVSDTDIVKKWRDSKVAEVIVSGLSSVLFTFYSIREVGSRFL